MPTAVSIKDSIKQILPSTTSTWWWILKITVAISAAMMLLKYFEILPVIATFVEPVFKIFGLPGDVALAYVSGYFVNVYSALAVIGTLDLTVRQITIIGTMVLCAHSMILETAVLRKTGVKGAPMIIIRTISSIVLGLALNLMLPQDSSAIANTSYEVLEKQPFNFMFITWLKDTFKLIITMTIIIFSLNIIQKLLKDFGIMEKISHLLSPIMVFFGLPKHTAFLWMVANIVGLGYGAAAMLDELEQGSVSHDDIILVDTHISISHSNFEDLLLMTAMGGVWYIMLIARWGLSFLLVWGIRVKKLLIK